MMLEEKTRMAADPPAAVENPVDPAFDEALYLRAFPDIAEAVRRGGLASGLAHFRASGRAEDRLAKPEYRVLVDNPAGPPPPVTVDTLTVSRSGAALLTGWTDDRRDALTGISLETQDGARHVWTVFPRVARPDVGRTIDHAAAGHRFGFFLVGGAGETQGAGTENGTAVFHFASGARTTLTHAPALVGDAVLRDLVLSALPAAMGAGDDPALIRDMLDQDLGARIATLNRSIASQSRSRCHIERIGPSRAHYLGSIITSSRGPVEQRAPWLALTVTGADAPAHEFIHVVTDPDQFEAAARAAHVTEKTLGVPQTVVLHPGGDPAGAGEEAAGIARSGRLIFMDQTVFPRDPDWMPRHAAVVADAPEAQTRLFGGLLYHADGSLAQGGYYFDKEITMTPRGEDTPRRVSQIRLNRVTHPAPAAASALHQPHPVAGVPAAFLSTSRAWFERLGGFTRSYDRAALEDIDLCLRASREGFPAWVHPLRFWYFERRGALKPAPSRGGALLNAWLFHQRWHALIPSTLANGEG